MLLAMRPPRCFMLLLLYAAYVSLEAIYFYFYFAIASKTSNKHDSSMTKIVHFLFFLLFALYIRGGSIISSLCHMLIELSSFVAAHAAAAWSAFLKPKERASEIGEPGEHQPPGEGGCMMSEIGPC